MVVANAARVQPAQHVGRLQAVDHRILVGQVDAPDLALHQRAPHCRRLAAVAHQDGDIGRRQTRESAILFKADSGVIQQADNMLGAVAGEQFAISVGRQRFAVGGGGGNGQRLVRSGHAHQLLALRRRLDFLEWQRVLTRLAEAEGAAGETGVAAIGMALGVQEQLVDGVDQGGGGAVVGAQLVVAAGGGAARRKIAVDVGAAKAVDRLLGVADQEQAVRAVVGGHPVQQVEHGVLVGRGVLEFIDHRHRVLAGDALAQGLAVRSLQRVFQAHQHVGKTELAAAFLQLRHAAANAGGGVLDDGVAHRFQLQ